MKIYPQLAPLAFLILAACKTPDAPTSQVTAPPAPSTTPGGHEGEETYGDLSPEEIFNKTESVFSPTIHELHIHMRSDTFGKTVTHKDQGGYACLDNAPYGRVERFTFINKVTGESIDLKDIGIKVRGNTSCGAFRKQFKLKFDANASIIENDQGVAVVRLRRVFQGSGEDVVYDQDDADRIDKQTLYGLKTISLRASSNDPTAARDRLASETFAYGDELGRSTGRPGAALRGGAVYRVGYTRLFMHLHGDTQDFGVYALTEGIDKTMFRTRWGKGIRHAFQGNLARATFVSLPSNRKELLTNYEPSLIDGKGYEDDALYDAVKEAVESGKLPPEQLATLEDQRVSAAKILNDFADALSKAKTRQAIETLVDVDNFLSYLAAANMVGHWDSLVGNANNDWLVFNDETGKWQIVVWDLDNTLGTAVTGSSPFNSWWNARYDEFRKGGSDLLNANRRPLFAALLQLFATEYRQRFKEFLEGVYDLHKMNSRIVSLRDVLNPQRHDDDQWEVLFNFKNHRWAHGFCSTRPNGKRAVIGGDQKPVFVNYQERQPKCQ